MLDGPTGRLGRCLGPQTLELTFEGWGGWNQALPCGPVIKIDAVRYFDADDVEQTVSDTDYKLHQGRIWFGRNFFRPGLGSLGTISIGYQAGYDGTTTGKVPPEAIQAVILLAQHSLSVGAANLFVASEEVEGVGSTRYVVSDNADSVIMRAVDNLTAGLRVISV